MGANRIDGSENRSPRANRDARSTYHPPAEARVFRKSFVVARRHGQYKPPDSLVDRPSMMPLSLSSARERASTSSLHPAPSSRKGRATH